MVSELGFSDSVVESTGVQLLFEVLEVVVAAAIFMSIQRRIYYLAEARVESRRCQWHHSFSLRIIEGCVFNRLAVVPVIFPVREVTSVPGISIVALMSVHTDTVAEATRQNRQNAEATD